MPQPYRTYCLLLCVLASLAPGKAELIVRDEATRRQALQTIFPSFPITLLRGKKINLVWRPRDRRKALIFRDALSQEPVYRIEGQPLSDDERCAAENMEQERITSTREVRLRLYALQPQRGRTKEFVAVLQYRFSEASPALSCPSIGRLVYLTRDGSRWRILTEHTMETTHHRALQSITMKDLDNDGNEELLLEADSGGACTVYSSLQVFTLAAGRLETVLAVPSQFYSCMDGEEQFVQRLDRQRTQQQHGSQFCFTKVTYAKGNKWLRKPQSRPICYPRGTGITPQP